MNAKIYYDNIKDKHYAMVWIKIKQCSSIVWKQKDSLQQRIALEIKRMIKKEESLFLLEDAILVYLHRDSTTITSWFTSLCDTIECFSYFHIAVGVAFCSTQEPYATCRKKAEYACSYPQDYDKYTSSLHFYDTQMLQEQTHLEQMNYYLQHAYTHHMFQVFFQPKIDVQSKKIVGGEALLRLFDHHKQYPLSRILPFANANAFIRMLDLFVFDQTCQFLSLCQEKGYQLLPISINISLASFLDHTFYLREVKRILHQYHLPNNLIEFELSEDINLSQSKHTDTVLDQLHHMGHRIALDDFGSGYSSFSILSETDIDCVKLDQCFCQEPFHPKRKQLIASLVTLLKQQNCEIIVEGVETQEVLSFFESLPIDGIQGFYFYPPLSQNDYLALLEL